MSVYIDGESIRAVGGQIRVDRATSALPQTTTADIFSIDGGRVVVLGLYGEVTTVIQTQANNTKLTFDPDTGAADADLCAVLDITAQAVGTLNSITGTAATALTAHASGAVFVTANMDARGIVLAEGDIKLNCAASSTGAIQWTILYRPLDAGAVVTAV